MSGKSPMQANGRNGDRVHSDGVSERPSGRTAAGESGGGAYPNPHRGKKPHHSPSDFMGHGGQSEIGYHGAGQLGEQKVDEQEGAREAATRKG
ncbi:hypothetical protein [Sphingomonas sp. SRS2]|uniref:hypothetical protein n=1 Tax=Sphingomonas sp. SRS2 TaxID=133190 RepID=UPI000AAAA195|nr:hypothetical protein [Sphingomonas sp. SRS2]